MPEISVIEFKPRFTRSKATQNALQGGPEGVSRTATNHPATMHCLCASRARVSVGFFYLPEISGIEFKPRFTKFAQQI